MAKDAKLNVLLVGGGMISQEVVIPTILQQAANGLVKNLAISALTGQVTGECLELFGDKKITYYPDPRKVDPKERFPEMWEEALKKLKKPGLVYIATPDHFHTSMVLAAIEAGHDVVCMKPLCLKVAEAHQIIETAEKHNTYVFTEYHKRRDRAVRALRYRYRKGELGEALYGHAWIEEPKYMPLDKFGLWCEKSSPFEYIGTHYADVYYYVTGLMPRRVVAFGQKKFLPRHNINAYDAIQAVVEWENDSAFWIQTSWVCADNNAQMTQQGMMLQGTAGEYKADHANRNCYFVTDDGGYENFNPNFFKPFDNWDGGDVPDYTGYGFESNSQGIFDVVKLVQETQGLSKKAAAAKRKKLIKGWEKLATRALPRHALVGVAINEAVRMSVDNGSRFVEFDKDLYPKLV